MVLILEKTKRKFKSLRNLSFGRILQNCYLKRERNGEKVLFSFTRILIKFKKFSLYFFLIKPHLTLNLTADQTFIDCVFMEFWLTAYF